MKHQKEIFGQRIVNMKAGIDTSLVFLGILQDDLDKQLNSNTDDFDKIKEILVQDIQEIREFINWVKNQ